MYPRRCAGVVRPPVSERVTVNTAQPYGKQTVQSRSEQGVANVARAVGDAFSRVKGCSKECGE
jgi:hypothetical protein